MPDGRQKWETVGTDKEQAVKLLRKRLSNMDFGRFVEPKKLIFAEFADKWLASLDGEVANDDLCPSTRATYRSVVDEHLRPYFGQRPLQKITRLDVKEFLATKKSRAPKTITNIERVLGRMFADAVEDGYANFNPAQKIGRKKGRRKQGRGEDGIRRKSQLRIPTPAELQAFFSNVEPEYFPIFLCVALTGLRRGEVVALQWGDVDIQGAMLYVRRAWCRYAKGFKTPKNRREGKIDLGPASCQLFASLLTECNGKAKPTDLVFPSPTGGVIDPDNLYKQHFVPAVRRANLEPFTLQSLRHLYDSAALSAAKGEIKWVRGQMRHATVQMTLDQYGHLLQPSRPELGERTEATILGEFGRKLLGSGTGVPS